MYHKLKKISIIVLLLSSLAACNSGTGNNSAANSSTSTPYSTATIATGAKASINVMTTGQKTTYAPRDDGELQPGGEIDGVRFVSGTGAEADCIIDKTTGFMWPKKWQIISQELLGRQPK